MAEKKVKIRYKRVLVFFLILFVSFLFFLWIINLRIKNIYISGNNYFSDQEIIEFAKIENYPRTFFNSCLSLKNRIISSGFFSSVSVTKKNFTSVYISVSENRPLFYSEVRGKTVFLNGEVSSRMFNVPVLTNDISNDIYSDFLKKFSLIDLSVLDIISEFSYMPNDVDKELFLFVMNDGNYVYINMDRFSSINKYFDMVTKFNNHKGVLYLDSGEYFKILDN